MAKHPSKTLRWKWQSFKNWLYSWFWKKPTQVFKKHEDKEIPYLFNFRENTYEYGPRGKEEEGELEQVPYTIEQTDVRGFGTQQHGNARTKIRKEIAKNERISTKICGVWEINDGDE
jgi:hypothetical protein